MDSLVAFRNGFTLSLLAFYTRRVTQRQHIRFDGWEVYQKKHAFLGTPAGSAAFGLRLQAHIVFPNMSVDASTQLTDQEQERWLDRVLLPELRAIGSSDELHHYLFSFQDIKRRAQTNQEQRISGRHQALDIQVHLAEDKLAPLWTKILHIISDSIRNEGGRFSPLRAYQDPALVVSGHGLKLLFKHDSPAAVKDRLFTVMEACFNHQYYREDQIWVDLGMEDVPARPYDHPQPGAYRGLIPRENLTLLRAVQ